MEAVTTFCQHLTWQRCRSSAGSSSIKSSSSRDESPGAPSSSRALVTARKNIYKPCPVHSLSSLYRAPCCKRETTFIRPLKVPGSPATISLLSYWTTINPLLQLQEALRATVSGVALEKLNSNQSRRKFYFPPRMASQRAVWNMAHVTAIPVTFTTGP